MIQYFLKTNSALKVVDRPEKDGWINIYPPFTKEELQKISQTLQIPLDYFTDSLDINERSRFEQEEGVKLIVINTPVENEDAEEYEPRFITVPVGIIILEDKILTISARQNPVIDWFIKHTVKGLQPHDRSMFVLKIFEKNVEYFLYHLREINRKINLFEEEIFNSSRNEDFVKLLTIQKSLVYYVNYLRANELMMLKLKRTNFLNIQHREEASDFFEDIVVDNSQALEMSQLYANILNGTLGSMSSIISNNLNNTMKRLTAITIVIAIPTLVASIWGMNVHVPFENIPFAFPLIILFSLLISFLAAWYFYRKKLF